MLSRVGSCHCDFGRRRVDDGWEADGYDNGYDTFLKPSTGLMLPSHATMLLAPIADEEERRVQHNDYAAAMEDWKEFAIQRIICMGWT